MYGRTTLVVVGLAFLAIGSHNGGCNHNRFPNDPLFDFQWGHHNTGQEVEDFDVALDHFWGHPTRTGEPDSDTNAPRAWHFGTDCPDVIFAVIDTGVDYTHPDLVDNLWVNEAEQNGNPGVDDDGNGYVDDIYGWNFYHQGVPGGVLDIPAGQGVVPGGDGPPDDPLDVDGHGTLIAGVYGARGNNGEGVAGVCWTGEIMALKAFPEVLNGEAPFFVNPVDAVIDAIDYAIDIAEREDKRLVINMSWSIALFDLESQGAPSPPPAFAAAVQRLHDEGHLIVTGIGNGNMHEFEEPSGIDVNAIPNSHQGGCWVDCEGGLCGPPAGSCSEPGEGCERCSPAEPLVLSAYPQHMTDEHIFHAIAVNMQDEMAAWSWWGLPQGITGTPGEYLWTTLPTYPIPVSDPDPDLRWESPEGELLPYVGMSGTSLAAPYLGGALALALAEHPAIADDLASADPATRSQGYQALRNLIVQAVDPLPSMAGKSVSGGRLNLHRVVRPLP